MLQALRKQKTSNQCFKTSITTPHNNKHPQTVPTQHSKTSQSCTRGFFKPLLFVQLCKKLLVQGPLQSLLSITFVAATAPPAGAAEPSTCQPNLRYMILQDLRKVLKAGLLCRDCIGLLVSLAAEILQACTHFCSLLLGRLGLLNDHTTQYTTRKNKQDFLIESFDVPCCS